MGSIKYMMMKTVELLNQQYFLSLNAIPSTSPKIISFATFCAQYTLFIIPVTLLILWFLKGKKGHQQVLFCILTILIALLLNFIIAALWYHPRPFMLPLGKTWINHAPDTSFPSDHATLFFSAGLSLLVSNARRSGVLILFISIFVAWSRIFLGVHFPLDIAGAILVTISALFLTYYAWKLVGDTLTGYCERISIYLFSWLPDKFTP